MIAKISKRSAAFVALLMIASAVFIPMSVMAGPVIVASVTSDNPQTAAPGKSVIFNISIQNTGDADSTVNLSVSGNGTWTAQLSTSQIQVQQGSTTTIYLTVGVPSTAQADSVGKAIVVEAKYYSGSTEQVKQATTTTKVSQVYSFTMAIDGSFNKDIAPGTSGVFSLTVNQTASGNGVNYINLSPTGEQPDKLIISYSQNPVTMQPFSPTTITVTVYVPQDALAKQYSYIIGGNSQGGGSAQTANIIINVTQVWGISLEATQAVQYVNPDSLISYTINVNNTGNKADTFDVTAVDFLSGSTGWTETHTSSIGPINPKTIGQVSVQVYAPLSAPYPNSMQVRVNVTSETNTTIVRSLTLTAVINKVNSTFVSANPFINTTDPGGTVGYVISVKNSGNGQSTIDLTLPSFPGEMTPSLDRTSIDLKADETATVNLTVSVGKNAIVGDNNIVVRATARGTSAMSNFTIIVRVNQIYNVSVFPSGSYQQDISPGFKAMYGVTVKNTGNGNDSFTMTNGTAPAGLTTYFDSYIVNLGPGESQTINATVEVAKGTPSASHNIDLKATSIGNNAKSASTQIIAKVLQHYEVVVSTPSAYNNTNPGKTAGYTVMVRNLGSGSDTFSITAGGDNPAWVKFENSSLQLPPGVAQNITVTINVPSDALKTNVTTNVKATSDANSTANATVALITVIDANYSVQVWASPNSADVKPGENGKYSIIIKNSGNNKDTFFVNLTQNPNNWASLDIASPFVALDAGAFYTANLTVAVPVDAKVALWPAEVLATSQGNSVIKSSIITLTNVTAIYNVELIVNNANATGEPTDTINFDVRVKNTGNGADNFTLDITGEKRSWAILGNSIIMLNSSESRSVTLSVLIPDNELVANHTISFKATCMGNTSRSQTAALSIIVKPKHDLDITSADYIIKKKADPGTTIYFYINVTNKGPEQDTVNLVMSGNNTNWASLSQDSVLLNAGAFQIVNMSVQVPSNALPSSLIYSITGTLKSNANRTKLLTLTVTVGQIYKVEISSQLSENSTTPGGYVTYNVKVRNIGSGNDTIQLTALNYSTWVSFSKSSVILAPDGMEMITVTITVPSKPLPTMGDYNISIRAKSIGNESVLNDLVLVMTINQTYGVKVSSNVTVTYVDPGQSARYAISVKNDGNGKDSFSLTKGSDPKSVDHTDWVTFSSSSITLEAGATSVVNLIVQVPSNAFNQTFTTLVNVTSQGNLTYVQTISLTTTINLLYGLELTASDTYKELKNPTSTSVFNLTVRNTGNSNDIMDFEAMGARLDWVTFNVSNVQLGPGNSTGVKVTVTPPWSTPYDKMSGTYTNLIKVTSRGYSFATQNVTLTTKIDITYGVEATWDATTKISGPGGSVTFNVTIKNTGNIGDSYQARALTFTTWAAFNNNNVSIGSASLETVMMTVNVPVGQANQDYMVTVEVKSSGNDTKKVSQDIKVTVSEKFGVSLSSEDTAKDCGQGGSVVYTVTVKNTGNVLQDIDLKITEGNYKDWATMSKSSSHLGEKGEEEITVTVRVPADQQAGNYDVTLKAEVRGHTDGMGTTTMVLTTSVFYGVDLTTKEAKKKAKVNEMVTFNVTVKNKGSGNDTYDLSILDPYTTWFVTFDFDLFELAKDKSKLVQVTLKVDKDAEKQDYAISLKVASDGDSTKTSILVLTIAVEVTPSLKIESPDTDEKARPGQSILFSLKLTNNGNGPSTYKLKINDGDYTTWVSLGKESTQLAVDQVDDIGVTVTLPNDAVAGMYNFTIKVWVSDDEAIFQTITYKVRVEEVYNFQISTDESSIEGAPGDSIYYTLKLENTGNSVDTYDIQVKDLPNNWTYSVSSSYTLEHDTKLTFLVTINITGDYLKAKADNYAFTIKLVSRGNDTVEKSLSLTTVVTQKYGLEASPEASSTSKDLDPYGDDIEFDLNLKNTGNGEDTVTFRIKRYPSGWSTSFFTFSPTAVTILPGSTSAMKTVTVRISSSSVESDAGRYDFVVVAISKNGDEFTCTPIYINVIRGEVSNLAQSDITVSKLNPNKGDVVSVTVTVKNSGTADMRNIVVTLYAAGNPVASKTISSTIRKNGEAQTTLEWTTDSTGDFKLKIAAKYGIEDPVELTLTQQVKVTDKSATGDLLAGNNLLIIMMIVIIVVIVIAVAARPKKTLPPPPPVRQAARPAVAPRPAAPPVKAPLDDEDEEEDEDDIPAPPKAPVAPPVAPAAGAKPKIARIKCPKCGTMKDVTTPVRPYEFNCEKCSTKLRLAK